MILSPESIKKYAQKIRISNWKPALLCKKLINK